MLATQRLKPLTLCRIGLTVVMVGLPVGAHAATESTSGHSIEWAHHDNGSDITWQAATQYCEALGQGWALPTAAELFSLFDPAESVRCGWNYCHTLSRFNLTGNWFWSSQIQPNNKALGVNLDLGRVDEQSVDPQGFGRALCVKRTG